MNKKVVISLIIIASLFTVVPFFFNTYNILRLISVLFGIILITLSLALKENKNIYLIFIIPLVLIGLTYSLDIFLYTKFSRLPLYIYEINSNDQISTYNSFFYRIYNCNNNLTLDYGYEKKYVCSPDSLEEIDINNFLNNPLDSYQNYKNKFVKIHGKISKISGRENMELNAYDTLENSLNGYVNFNDEYKVSVILDEDLSNYRIYDFISVIGRVDKYENGTIILQDAYTIPSDIYDTFTYEVELNNTSNITNLINNYYLYGITSINIKYSENAIYELSYLIADNKITIDDIIGNNGGKILRDEDNNITARKYELSDFNILACENSNYIFANKNSDLDNTFCSLEDSNNN